MRRGLIKLILIILTAFVGMSIFSILRVSGVGVLWLWIVAAGMIAAIKAIWSYDSTSKEVSLKKDD